MFAKLTYLILKKRGYAREFINIPYNYFVFFRQY